MKYKIIYSSKFKKAYKKLNAKEEKETDMIIERLANDEILESKYKDHALKGDYADFRECHIKPDLLLIYRKNENILELYLAILGNHNNIF